MKWNKPEITINKFDKENIITVSVMSVESARKIIDIQGAESNFLASWIKK